MKFALFLSDSFTELQSYLESKGWLPAGTPIQDVHKPGEATMNVVIRVVSPVRSLVLKQSRPYLTKYPEILAPLERIEVESAFYYLNREVSELQEFLPKVIGHDFENHLLAMENLGNGPDYELLYRMETNVTDNLLNDSLKFLSILHNYPYTLEQREDFPKNLVMRNLNYEQLFVYPLIVNNGLDLDEVQNGLQHVAAKYQNDEELKLKMRELGIIYLSPGPNLLHGDFCPGNWLNISGEFKVVDPEFAYFGRAEFDVGVMIAHLKMAQAAEDKLESVWQIYQQPPGFSEALANQFTGMEIIRRILGIAQLPLDLNLDEKDALLTEARGLICGL